MEWRPLGATAPTELIDPRIQAHWGAQVILAVADGWIEAKPDDNHTNMEWLAEHDALVGNPTPAGLCLGLRPGDLTLVGLWRDGRTQGTYPLVGRTLAEALTWADDCVARAARTSPRGIKPRDYDMPTHAVASGSPFSADRASLEELGRWFGNGDALLREIAAAEPGATPIRCWPHHFDIAGIVFLDPDAPADKARQIGFGLSPGDHSYPEPYFYVTPWPIREGAAYPLLDGGGYWHRKGFTGAVLEGSVLVADDGQLARTRAYFASALNAARKIMPGPI
jgi:hypothetical protein